MKQSLLQKLVGGFLAAFGRRYKHAKIANPVQRLNRRKIVRNGRKVRTSKYHHAIAYLTSRLGIKREGNQANLQARVYKRAFGGVCGALTWSDFDKGNVRIGTPAMRQRIAENRERRAPWYAARAAKAASIRASRGPFAEAA